MVEHGPEILIYIPEILNIYLRPRKPCPAWVPEVPEIPEIFSGVNRETVS